MRRLRTENSPYISILSIGVEESDTKEPVLTLSCGLLTPEIRARLELVESIHLTSLKNSFKLDALDKDGDFLGALVRHDLEFATSIHKTLRRRLEADASIRLRLFSILKPDDYVMKEISSVVTRESTGLRKAA